MNRLRFLVLALVVGLVMAFPSAALGQAVPDHQSRLVVTINGEMAPDDTKVTAIMDGEDVAMAMTKDGIAFLKVPGTSATVGMEISFMVGDLMAAETDTWERGGHQDKNFEIEITTYAAPPPVPPPHFEASGEHRRASRPRRDGGHGLDGRRVGGDGVDRQRRGLYQD